MAQWQIGHNGGGVGQAWLYTGDANGDAGGPRASDELAPGVTIMAAVVGDIPGEAGGARHTVVLDATCPRWRHDGRAHAA